MDDLKLIAAAKRGAGDFFSVFMDENKGQSFTSDDVNDAWEFYKNPRTNKNRSFSTGGRDTSWKGGWGGGVGGSGNMAQRIVTSQIKPETAGDEFGSLQKNVLGVLFNESGGFRGVKGSIKEIAKLFKDEVIIYLQEQADILHKINGEAGMLGTLSEDFRKEIMKSTPETIRLGVTFEDMLDSVSGLVASSGKFKLLSSDTIKEMALASKFTDNMKTLAGMAGNFERAGIGAKDMSLMVERMGIKSMGLGLNARETTKLINENLKNLNLYGFKNGVDGLNKMVQTSIEFRMNMQNVYDLAKKVWDPDGALEVVANLQMIGGAYGDLNDPIKLMYMATNDVEGLQEAIKGAAKSLVTYNAEQGRFQITGANLRRAKEMADQLGMSMEELTTTAVATMERTAAASDLMGRGLEISDENREFLTNLAQMKGGKMTIEVPESIQKELGLEGTNLALESLTQEQANLLISRQEELKNKTMEEIAREQVTLIENVERDVSFLRAVARVGLGQKAGDMIEQALGINSQFLSKESKKITDSVAAGISKGPEYLQQLMDNNPDVFKNKGKIRAETEAKNKEIESVTQNVKETKVKETPVETSRRDVLDVNINPTSALVDDAARAIWRDPQFMADFRLNFRKGYLSPSTN